MIRHRMHPPYELLPPYDESCMYVRLCKSTKSPERGVDMHFIYRGDDVAVHFGLATNWHVWEMGEQTRWPIPLGLAVHSRGGDSECPVIGGKCQLKSLGRGTYLIDKLVRGGDGAVWDELERIYLEKLPAMQG